MTVEDRIKQNIKKKNHLLFSLVDTENISDLSDLVTNLEASNVDAILVGGSTIADQVHLDNAVKIIKSRTSMPVILFPGNITGISRHADAILFSSLLNSNDPYFLIGAQAIASHTVWKYKLEAIPMAYLIAGEGVSAGFIGNARIFPKEKPELIVAYALAAQYLGMRFLYLEAGSGARKSIPPSVIKLVRSYYNGIMIVGGGIRNPETAKAVANAGADIIVVGNLLETSDYFPKLKNISNAIHSH